jgi:hypothetical protein
LSVRLLKGARSDDTSREHKWYVAAYSADQVEELKRVYSEASLPLIHNLAGMEVLIPQSQLLDELRLGSLDFGAEGFNVIRR